MKMTVNSSVPKAASSSDIETSESQKRMQSTRKRKSEDVGCNNVDEFPSCPEFTTSIRNEKPAIVNCQEAFFDKNNPRVPSCLSTGSPVKPFASNERTIKLSKSFCYEDERITCVVTNTSSPQSSPRAFRQEFHKMPTPTPSHYNCTGLASPLSVVDELFTGFYGCMPQWECSMPWRGDSDDDDDTQDEEEDNDDDFILRHNVLRQDAEAMREHLSFPKQLGKEHVSQSAEGRRRERNTTRNNRTIRRSPSSRLTTLESDSRHKLPGSKMFRRTEINKVTEIHWDEKVLDTATLEQMAKLSV